ncbi:DUF2797 domain-containing protein [Candidatus Berkiella aquae]|uniref:DUF2797 domain-containing protein n=1 Tax=Candidatus Berkiella aquae TaxID=295108 RepID=A0A0Q9YSA2_9GAMM|nr:DUF2797 domain-containing protein [Candidatus Berkiella aquae]MCS5711862.1 DUF2797 domain-containing protein [Candidatus Berkiella aquae]
MIFDGVLSKMVADTTQSTISYQLPLSSNLIPLNPYLGKTLQLTFTGEIVCVGCTAVIRKSYQNGYCFPCTQRLANCDLCIVKPERCHFHLDTCREPQWGQSYCMTSHYVYLANASGIKVGITRKTQIPTRWIDQGAVAGLPLLEVATRRISGFIEVAIAKHVPDKTNWRRMLMGNHESVDLMQFKKDLLDKVAKDIEQIRQQFGQDSIKTMDDAQIMQLDYPVLQYPAKVTSLSLDKKMEINSTLLGIKGQYLIFADGVINIRKYSGYKIRLTTPD